MTATTSAAPDRRDGAGGFDADQIAELKRRNPLAEYVRASGVLLRPCGQGRWKGLCPFHDDTEPSFFVYESDQHFHCYSGVCKFPHGDIFDYGMRRERLTFAEMCRRLAARAGLPVGPIGASSPAPVEPERAIVVVAAATQRSPRPAGIQSETQSRWEHLTFEEQLVMDTATAVYQDSLWHSAEGQRALAYLRARGLPDHVIRGCRLGLADGHSLETYLRRRSGLRLAQSLGLLRRADGASAARRPLREFFAGRIVVPELRAGRAIWFIGRALDGHPGGGGAGRAKYLSLEGERPILGLERAAGRRILFVCEGVFDWLTAVAWGLAAISPCGTHVPPERLAFLDRAERIYGVFDADEAGRAAAERLRAQFGARFLPIALPDGWDLNDLLQREGAAGRRTFWRLVHGAGAPSPPLPPSPTTHLPAQPAAGSPTPAASAFPPPLVPTTQLQH